MSFNLILDSGAFSAWTKKEPIDINKYLEFCLKHLNDVEYIVNLDIIPGEPGAISEDQLSKKEIGQAAQKGWENYNFLIENGVPREKLIPVFHQGEELSWLQRLCHASEYIGLSPANDRTTDEKIEWLDKCMTFVCDKHGDPVVKFHGFGVTSVRILLEYPWYSVDSASWVMFSRYGTVLVPKVDANGQWKYDTAPMSVQITLRAPTIQKKGYQHYNSMNRHAQEIIRKYIYEKGFVLGRSLMKDGNEIIVHSGVCNDHRMRDLLNLQFYIDLGKHIQPWPWRYKFKDFVF